MKEVYSHAPGASTANGEGVDYAAAFRDIIRSAYQAKCSLVPSREDGTKAPYGEWKPYQHKRASADQIRRWYGDKGTLRRRGLGVVCGSISGNLEVLEFDAGGVDYEPFKEAAAALGLGELVERIEAGWLDRSPSGGVHWHYRCETIAGNTVLAQYESDEVNPETGGPKVKPLIETRGEGGFIIIAPSYGTVHPTGRPYERLRGGPETVATITPEERQALHDLARTFDRMPEAVAPDPAQAKERKEHSTGWSDAVATWDDFNARTGWPDILPAGWQMVHRQGETELWRRPGKDRGQSATINRNGSDRLYVFSSSTPFATHKPYSKFDAYALLNHGGSFSEAARALCARGYGTFKTWVEKEGKWVLETRQNPCPKGVRIARSGEGPPVTVEEFGSRPGDANGEHGAGGAGEKKADNRGDFFSTLSDEDMGVLDADKIDPEPVEWLWDGRLAVGRYTGLAAYGGEGKSQTTIRVAASITGNGPLPDGSFPSKTGWCLFLGAEDGYKDTVIPRMIAAGVDRSKVKILKARFTTREKNGSKAIHPVSFQDLAYWEDIFRRFPETRLLVCDPLPAYLGRGVNDHKNADVQSILTPFIELLGERGISMLGATHVGKSTEARRAVDKILGSVAYVNIARAFLVIVQDPDNKGRRLLFTEKHNLTDKPPTLAFRIVGESIDWKDKTVKTSRVEFESGPVEGDAGDMMSAARGGKKRGPEPKTTTEAAEWLVDFLKAEQQPVPIAAIFDAAGQAGHAGKVKPDGRWAGVGTMYNAVKLVPELPEPWAGFRVETLEVSVKPGGRKIKHWYLCGANSVF